MMFVWKNLKALSALIAVIAVAGWTHGASATTYLELTMYNIDGPTDWDGTDAIAITRTEENTFEITFVNNSVDGASEIDMIFFENSWASILDVSDPNNMLLTGEGGNADFSQAPPPNSDLSPQGAGMIGWSGTLELGTCDPNCDAYGVFTSNQGNGITDTTAPDGGTNDYITITVVLKGDPTEGQLANWIVNNQSIAAHVQDCAGSVSCATVATPIPGAVWLLGSALLGLFGFGGIRRRMSGA